MTDVDDLDVQRRKLALIHEEFPEFAWNRYTCITEGWDHFVIVFDDNFVFRFPLDEDSVRRLVTEIEVLKYVKTLTSVTVPCYSRIACDNSFAGYPIVPGVVLTPERFKSFAPDIQNIVIAQLADFLSSIHGASIKNTPLARVSDSLLSEDQEEIRALAGKQLKERLSRAELLVVDNILQRVDALLSTNLPRVFIHNDIYSRHLLWEMSKQELGIIDFGDMSVGDPAIDFSELYAYGSTFVHAVYEQYRGEKDTEFLRRAWTYQQWKGVYMLTDFFLVGKTSWEVARETFDHFCTRKLNV